MYALISFITSNKLKLVGNVLSKQQNIITNSLQDGFRAIKDILLSNSQPIYVSNYKKSDYKLRKAQGNNVIISATPRYLIESFGMIIIAPSYNMTKNGIDNLFILQTLGPLAVSAQRLLPLLQQVYHARTYVLAHKKVLIDVIDLLDQKVPNLYKEHKLLDFKFEKFIEFKGVFFEYNKNSEVLKGISFKIPKGSKIGFTGSTGSGKSTILDILMDY